MQKFDTHDQEGRLDNLETALQAWEKACQTGHLINRQKAAGLAEAQQDPTRAAA